MYASRYVTEYVIYQSALSGLFIFYDYLFKWPRLGTTKKLSRI